MANQPHLGWGLVMPHRHWRETGRLLEARTAVEPGGLAWSEKPGIAAQLSQPSTDQRGSSRCLHPRI